MARGLNGVNQRLDTGFALSQYIANGTAYSVHVWLRALGSTPLQDNGHVWLLPQVFGEPNAYWGLARGKIVGTSPEQDCWWAWSFNGALGGPGGGGRMIGWPVTPGVWEPVGMVQVPGSPGSLYLFVGGVERGSVTCNAPDVRTGNVSVGGGGFDGAFLQGDVAEAFITFDNLRASGQMAALAKGASPWNMNNFPSPGVDLQTMYAPIWGIHSPEPDFSGHNFKNLTLIGNPPKVDGPPVSWFQLEPIGPPMDAISNPLPFIAGQSASGDPYGRAASGDPYGRSASGDGWGKSGGKF